MSEKPVPRLVKLPDEVIEIYEIESKLERK
jgi:hypothetical protein